MLVYYCTLYNKKLLLSLTGRLLSSSVREKKSHATVYGWGTRARLLDIGDLTPQM